MSALASKSRQHLLSTVLEKPENIKMIDLLDKHLSLHPTEGVNSMVYYLKDLGYPIGPKRIRRLFKVMGGEIIYCLKSLTKIGLEKFLWRYLLRGLKVAYANQVWSTVIAHIPMKKGCIYMTAMIDVHSH